jgi:serine/threonine-protein kinase
MLGKGSTGAVFLARRVEDTLPISEPTQAVPITFPDEAAIKILVLPWQLEEDGLAEYKARFLREAQTLQRLQHPHILPILAHGEDPVTGHFYMVLPYLAGGTLATQLGPDRMPLERVATTLSQIAGALDYAHSQQVVHRDIKPSNILLDGWNQAYVGDFSIARILAETHTRLTSTGRMMGTPEYMAPEQIDGRDVQAAADIYSLGMVVYRLVTGRVPFIATSIVELIRLQTHEPPPPPRTFRPDLPEPAEAAILRALEKDPVKRFNSASAFAEAFSLGLQGQWAAGLTPLPALDVERFSGGTTAQILPDINETTEPSRPRSGASLSERKRPLVLASAALLIVASVAFLFANPSNPILAILSPHVSVTATGGGMRANVTQAQRTATASNYPSGSGGGNTGGGGGNTGGGGGGIQQTATPKVAAATATARATARATATATRVPSPIPTSPPPTFYETTSGAGSGTFTDYTNAGGTVGQRVNPYTTIQITCRLTGFVVADGDSWWYRITQSPWNNQYYASADNFYNNGQTSGPPNSVFVDTNVPLC